MCSSDLGDALEKKLHFNTNYTLRGGWTATAALLVESFGYDPDLYRNHYIERHVGTAVDTIPFTGTPRIANLDYVVSVGSPNFKHLNFSVFYIWGRDENFFEWASADIDYLTLNADWRPTTQLRVSHSYVMQSYRRRTDGSLVGRTQIPRLKTEYQFSRAIFLRYIGQYVAEDRTALVDSRTGLPLLPSPLGESSFGPSGAEVVNEFRNDLLFSYKPTPGTVFFVGYGASLTEPDAFRLSRDRLRRTADGFFLKASYRYRI